MGKYIFLSDGEANFYIILRNTEWFARVQLNGEMHLKEQLKIMQMTVDMLNEKER